jgi:hypothetical protein
MPGTRRRRRWRRGLWLLSALLVAFSTVGPGSGTGAEAVAQPHGCPWSAARARRGRRAAGGLQGQPTLLHGRIRQAHRSQGDLSDGIAHLEQLPRRPWSRCCGLWRREQQLSRLPRLPQGSRAQLHSALAVGAVQVPGRRRAVPPLHDTAALAADRAWNRVRRKAEVRPLQAPSGVFRPAPGARPRGRQQGHLCLE